MIGLVQRSVENWRNAKANGWTLDGTTLRHMADDIERDIASHEAVAAGIKDRAAREDFDSVFAADLGTAKTALAEIQAARPGAPPPWWPRKD